MKFMSRKLIIAGGAIALTAACAVTVTYAWFARNNVAWIDEYDYNVKSSAGILISTDGTTFTQNVSKSEIKKVIENWAGDNANYSELKYGQSTLGTYENGNITHSISTPIIVGVLAFCLFLLSIIIITFSKTIKFKNPVYIIPYNSVGKKKKPSAKSARQKF